MKKIWGEEDNPLVKIIYRPKKFLPLGIKLHRKPGFPNPHIPLDKFSIFGIIESTYKCIPEICDDRGK